jgi:hypothetical protein
MIRLLSSKITTVFKAASLRRHVTFYRYVLKKLTITNPIKYSFAEQVGVVVTLETTRVVAVSNLVRKPE